MISYLPSIALECRSCGTFPAYLTYLIKRSLLIELSATVPTAWSCRLPVLPGHLGAVPTGCVNTMPLLAVCGVPRGRCIRKGEDWDSKTGGIVHSKWHVYSKMNGRSSVTEGREVEGRVEAVHLPINHLSRSRVFGDFVDHLEHSSCTLASVGSWVTNQRSGLDTNTRTHEWSRRTFRELDPCR